MRVSILCGGLANRWRGRAWGPVYRGGRLLRSLLVAGAAAGCADRSMYAPPCPAVAILADQGAWAVYAGPGRDLSDRLLAGRIAGVSGSCTLDRGDRLTVRARMTMAIERGRQAGPRTVRVPYFWAVARGGLVLDKQVYAMVVSFPAAVDGVRLSTRAVVLRLPVPAGVRSDSYTVYGGFQLTRDQLAANRAEADGAAVR